MGALAVPEDDDADNEFWNQEFFAEEMADERYETESEPEDRFDQDFNDSEVEEDGDEEVEELEDRTDFDGTKKKALKPPGSKRPPVKKKTAPSDISSPKPQKKPKILPERTMSVRSSTKEKVEQARAERKFIEETKGKRAYRRADHKQLTQAELLADAARTAIENTRSLLYMEAVEEENKRRASSNSGKYVGPMVSFASTRGEDGMEHSVLRIKHMSTTPEYLQPKVLPAPVKKGHLSDHQDGGQVSRSRHRNAVQHGGRISKNSGQGWAVGLWLPRPIYVVDFVDQHHSLMSDTGKDAGRERNLDASARSPRRLVALDLL